MSRLWEWRAGAAESAIPKRNAAAAVRFEGRNLLVMAVTFLEIRAECDRSPL
jgi:hypothetical protein